MKYASKIKRLEKAFRTKPPLVVTAVVVDGVVVDGVASWIVSSMTLSNGEVVDGGGRTPAECGLLKQRPPPVITFVVGLDLDIVVGRKPSPAGDPNEWSEEWKALWLRTAGKYYPREAAPWFEVKANVEN
jgi:hypothetical protein